MEKMSHWTFFVVVGLAYVLVTTGENSTTGQTTTTTVKPSSTTTPSVDLECAALNKSCGDCVSHAKCLWCSSKAPYCLAYPVGSVIPSNSYCNLNDARWGVCWVNYKVLLIVMGCLAGVLLISFSCCIYCCCCRSKNNKNKYRQEDAKFEEEREARQVKNAERKAERQSKYDEIRKKYGLMKDDSGASNSNSKYQRFENEA